MSYTYSSIIDPVLLTGSSALLYTTPANTRCVITKCNLRNTDATTVYKATLYIVPSGSSADATNMAMDAQSIDPKKVYSALDEMVGRILEPGDLIYGFADTASKISVAAGGLLIT